MSPQTTAKKPAEQADVTALVGEIGADTASIARHLAVIPIQIASSLPSRGPEEGLALGGEPRRPPAAAKASATTCNYRSTRVDRVDILAGSAPSSREVSGGGPGNALRPRATGVVVTGLASRRGRL